MTSDHASILHGYGEICGLKDIGTRPWPF